MGEVCIYTNRAERRLWNPPCNWYKLFELVRCRCRVSVSDQKEELCVVEQVQLRYECSFGLWDGVGADIYFLHFASEYKPLKTDLYVLIICFSSRMEACH